MGVNVPGSNRRRRRKDSTEQTSPAMTRKRTSSSDEEETELSHPRKAVFLTRPRLALRDEEMENVMVVRRCYAFDEDD